MRYLVFFFLFSIMFTNAQSIDIAQDSIRKGLSESELEIAKQKYMEMMQTDNYIQYERNISIMAEKLKGLEIFPQEKLDEFRANGGDIDESMEEYRKNWFEENIDKTDFKSLEEALEFYKSTEVLLKKNKERYKEFYQFIARANIEQIKQIFQPKFDKRDNMNLILINAPRY